MIATKHGKERALLPALMTRLGMFAEVLQLETDVFGTFTGEVPRQGSQRDALDAKLRAASDATPYEAVFFASEGAFFPNPSAPMLTVNREFVGMYDRETDRTIVGSALSYSPVAVSAEIATLAELDEVLHAAHFPSHAVVVRTSDRIVKGLTSREAIEAAVAAAFARGERVRVENDLRAHLNPTRMGTIARACNNLIDRLLSLCPQCGEPNFWPDRTELGLTCGDCGAPTSMPRAFFAQCDACGHRQHREVHGPGNPAACDDCNP